MKRRRTASENRRAGGQRIAVLILSLWNLPLTVGCDRAPREPVEPSPSDDSKQQPKESAGGEQASVSSATPPEVSEREPAPCVTPLADPPPPEVASVAECPADPDGRPQMPWGSVEFPEAPGTPKLRVELALTADHQQHGLMFRPTLSDEEGMLFSWNSETRRSFWMKNTCLALDMLFIARDGTIAGILENVPPWNTTPSRSVPCPAAHVLEVRAGWTRAHGVAPGQKMSVGPAAE